MPLKTSSILECLESIKSVRHPTTQLHLLGVTRCEHISRFREYGVTSFDSTSPLRQAFKDDKDNYYTRDRNFTAIRVPQIEGNPKLQARIRSGELCQDRTREMEQRCLRGLREYDRGALAVEEVLEVPVGVRADTSPCRKQRDRLSGGAHRTALVKVRLRHLHSYRN